MIFIGDTLIPYENISMIHSIDDIVSTKPNSTLVFDFDKQVLQYVSQNSISFGIIVSSIKEALYSNSLNAKYIIVSKEMSASIQKMADNYMFDSKVLAIISNEDEIETLAKKEIDGVIYSKVLG